MRIKYLHLLFFPAILLSCDTYPQDDYEEHYVVEAYLVANRQLPHIRLTTTVPVDQVYTFDNAVVDNANIQVRLLETGNGSNAEQTFNYIWTDPGTYQLTTSHKVLPKRTYELHITFPNSNKEISAYTVVPDTFKIMDGVKDTITYRSANQLEITVSESSYPGRQNIFIFNTISLSPELQNLTPLYLDFFNSGGSEADDLTLLANNNSGIINEGNFEINPDGSFTINYPWVGFSFFGDNLLVANTLDDNVYDFVRSQSVQLGGSTLSPGEIQNVIYNIKGGIGVFGSLASDTASTFLKRP